MTEKYHINLESVKKLNFPCPFCGEDLFSASCIIGELDISQYELCLVLEDKEEGEFKDCYLFCYFICSKRRIEIDMELIARKNIHSGKDVYCSDIDRVCSNIFRKLFSLISMDKGFKI